MKTWVVGDVVVTALLVTDPIVTPLSVTTSNVPEARVENESVDVVKSGFTTYESVVNLAKIKAI